MNTNKHSMGKIKLKLIINGNVQGVGYRVLIKQIARQLKIIGFVKNLDDGSVEMFCEGDSTYIEEFKKRIFVKGNKKDVFSLNVENIKETKIDRLPKTTTIFNIDYGEEASSEFEKANLERLEIGSLILTGFRDSTIDKFDSMESKYGVIHRQMGNVEKVLVDSLGTLTEQIIRSNENNAELIKVLISKFDSK